MVTLAGERRWDLYRLADATGQVGSFTGHIMTSSRKPLGDLIEVGGSHCTVRMTVVVRETEPPVAVTVIVDVPAGVPPLGVMVWAHP